jgi:uncharacterized membrane protein
MAELIVIGYPDETTAAEVMEQVEQAESEFLVDLVDAAVVVRHPNGKLKITTTDHLVAGTTLGGMFWGTLIGLIFLVPIAGLAIGGLIGAAAGGLSRLGIKEEFRSEVEGLVQPGTSAILTVVRKITPDKFIDEIKPYGGTVLRSSLTHEEEEQLIAALHGQARPAA